MKGEKSLLRSMLPCKGGMGIEEGSVGNIIYGVFCNFI